MKDVYTLRDLQSRTELDTGAEHPARLAVLGYPVAHSLSPQLHQPALESLGKEMRYIRLEVAPEEVGEALATLRDLGFVGANVTVPHKFAALEACDEVDAAARTLVVVNTVRFDGEIAL